MVYKTLDVAHEAVALEDCRSIEGPQVTEEYIGAAEITERGMVMSEASRQAMARALKGWQLGPLDVIVRPHQVRRSSRANRYYWGVVLGWISEETGQDKEAIHEEMCWQFLEKRVLTLTNKTTGETTERLLRGESSKLPVAKFYEFVERVRLWAAEWLQIEIPEPDIDGAGMVS